ncbi:MAG: hypothetical protein ABI411_07690 [Tahibacter sp.]
MINATKSTRILCWFYGVSACALPLSGSAAQQAANASEPKPAATVQRDGQRDFDFEIGTWTSRVSRLQHPLSGSTAWVTYEGTTLVRASMGGRANLAELDIAGKAGAIAGVSLRLYNPETQQWSLNFSNLRSGTLSPPTIGRFADGRGEFFGDESLDGRPIRVRFVVTCATSDSCRFEQAFSDDGGKSWEVNWIATDTRVAVGVVPAK